MLLALKYSPRFSNEIWSRMKILIADDHFIVREGLKQILKKLPDVAQIEEAANGIDALNLIEKSEYDIVILDISLPGMSGLEILEKLKSQNIEARVLILSMHPEEQFAIRALRSGALGYVTKDRAGEELLAAIRKISCGGKYVSSELAEYMVSKLNYEFETVLHEKLSEREFQIMIQLAKGKSSREIGSELFISEKTIGTYRFRIMQKMGMKKNSDLTFYALNNKLIE
jgi:two-component system, NarL family, invasion response regulator UvrY